MAKAATSKQKPTEEKQQQTIPQQVKALNFEERSKLVDHLTKAHQKDVEAHGQGQEPDGSAYYDQE